MKKLLIRMLLLGLLLIDIRANGQTVIALYEQGHIPNAKGNVPMPTLTAYLPGKYGSKYTAVIVCSGGAYAFRSDAGEGIPTCKKLQEAGMAAFLLDYRLPVDSGQMIHKELVPLMDAQRAIQYLREHANRLRISPNRIGILGFSAGGHLAATAATHFDTASIDNPDKTSLRPDFAVLVYPVISFADSITNKWSRDNLIGPNITPEKVMEYSNELHVTDNTPPIYLVHAMDDDGVNVKNSLYFEAALRQHHVRNEIFLYAKGGHAFNICNSLYKVQWIDDCMDWIKKRVWIK